MLPEMTLRTAGAGRAVQDGAVWRFSLGAGRGYQLAQCDEYAHVARHRSPRHAPFQLRLQARASHPQLPGTWGFGVWNDPFGFGVGQGGGVQLPALPNAAWFMFASGRNHLSLDDALPGNGGQAAVYRSPRIPSLLLTPGLLAAPLLAWPAGARGLRRAASQWVRQAAMALTRDVTAWHTYELLWQAGFVEFKVDGNLVLHSPIAPQPPLSVLLWLDNQYAAWLPSGRLQYGVETPQPGSWVEFRDLQVE